MIGLILGLGIFTKYLHGKKKKKGMNANSTNTSAKGTPTDFITPELLKLLIKLEGSEKKAYKDKIGKWTIGVGHLIKPNESYLLTKTLTESEVIDLLKQDVKDFAEKFISAVPVNTPVPLKQAVFALIFNIGKEKLSTVGVLKALQNGASKSEIAKQFLQWTRADNYPFLLVQRRTAELLHAFNDSNFIKNVLVNSGRGDLSKYQKLV